MNDRAWQDMLEEFRSLGGTADNVCLREGIYGRGLFPVDPAQPVAIRIPDNLLIDMSEATFEDGRFRVAPGSKVGARERAFLETYENDLSWGGGGRAEIEKIFEQAQALPAELRHDLETEYHCGPWFGAVSPSLVQEKFLGSRCISYKDRTVVMPIIELANHGEGAGYETTNDVALTGTFPGEVLVRYSNADSFGVFLSWGFAAEQPQAMSVALNGNIGQTPLKIGRDLGDLQPNERAWIPKLTKGPGGAELTFLVIGNRRYPRLCKGIFYKTMRDAGFSGFEEAFDTIQHVNRMNFLGLLAALEDVTGPMVQTLRRMARYQLQTMSFSYGVRAI
jgi:hypothetical protein